MSNREIKFRAWNGSKMVDCEKLTPLAVDPNLKTRGVFVPLEEYEVMQFTGLKDKNGVEIYEGDILRLNFKAGGEKDHWYTDAAYSVEPMNHEGFSLRARSMMSEDQRNQYPVHNTPSFHYRSLTTDHRNGNYDHLAVAETWGENTTFRTSWQQTHYSNDIAVIGNIYENPELLEVQKS